MQIAIDIPEEIYNYIHNEHIAMRVCDSHKVANAIANGTPLIEIFNEIEHKCHNCAHYLQGEYDGSCGSYICKDYSAWEQGEETKRIY